MARMIEANLMNLSMRFGLHEAGEVRTFADITRVYTGGKANNRVFIEEPQAGLARRLSEAVEFYRDRGAVALLITGPSSASRLTEEALAELGLVSRFGWTGMEVELDQFAQPEPNAEISEVTDISDLNGWAQVIFDSFSTRPDTRDDFLQLFVRLGVWREWPWHHYVAWVDGKPAAVTTLFIQGTVAGLYWVGTVPAMRGRGLATQLVTHALNASRSLGCTSAVLQASDSGKPVYTRLGFKDYCQFKLYPMGALPQ
jgi:GNAT superfamily N-acetyltransferase